jgi:hypothetical protein
LKKLFAITLLGILLFNWGGYRFVTDYLTNKADLRLEAQLDLDKYDEAALISIKIPTNLPYYTNTVLYERVDGSINIKGVEYKYVKRRIYNDSLELICIPNATKMGMQNARDDFFRLANDLVASNSNKKATGSHGHAIKFSVQDYTAVQAMIINHATQCVRIAVNTLVFQHFKSIYLSRLEKPPQV